MTIRFDTRRDDATPPTLTSLKLLNKDGIPVSYLKPGEGGDLLFSAADYAYDRSYGRILSSSTQLYLKPYGTKRWERIESVELLLHDESETSGYRPVGHYYRADLSCLSHLDSTAIDIRILLRDHHGNFTEWTSEPAFSVGVVFDPVPGDTSLTIYPLTFELFNNFPNPFNTNTHIRYHVPKKSEVNLKIFDIRGREIVSLVGAQQLPGYKVVEWDGKDETGQPVSSGVYIVMLQTPDILKAEKMLLIR